MAQEQSTPKEKEKEEAPPQGWRPVQQVFLLISAGLIVVAAVLAVMQWRRDPIKNLTAEDAEVRLEALDELAPQTSEEATEAIAGATADADDRVAARALILLGPRARRDHVPNFTKALADKRPLVREAAAVAMGQFHLRRIVDPKILIGVLNDPKQEPGVRAAAAQSLARLNVWAALPELAQALQLPGKENRVIRDRAANAAEVILGCELEDLRSTDWRDRAVAIEQIRQAWKSSTFRQSHEAEVERLERKAMDQEEDSAVD